MKTELKKLLLLLLALLLLCSGSKASFHLGATVQSGYAYVVKFLKILKRKRKKVNSLQDHKNLVLFLKENWFKRESVQKRIG